MRSISRTSSSVRHCATAAASAAQASPQSSAGSVIPPSSSSRVHRRKPPRAWKSWQAAGTVTPEESVKSITAVCRDVHLDSPSASDVISSSSSPSQNAATNCSSRTRGIPDKACPSPLSPSAVSHCNTSLTMGNPLRRRLRSPSSAQRKAPSSRRRHWRSGSSWRASPMRPRVPERPEPSGVMLTVRSFTEGGRLTTMHTATASVSSQVTSSRFFMSPTTPPKSSSPCLCLPGPGSVRTFSRRNPSCCPSHSTRSATSSQVHSAPIWHSKLSSPVRCCSMSGKIVNPDPSFSAVMPSGKTQTAGNRRGSPMVATSSSRSTGEDWTRSSRPSQQWAFMDRLREVRLGMLCRASRASSLSTVPQPGARP
mmetsp:Transcript_70516/g.187841  ORF Transcript_70516/g.187841 Transcript_70516/m.187841 type:complete len:367 (+) Transcript_70516:452-1552(+)